MRPIRTALLATVAFLLLPGLAHAQEAIRRYDVQLRLAADGTLHVLEEIDYDFADSPNRHGIYRDIPLSVAGEGGVRKLRFAFEPVRDARGERLTVETSVENGHHRLRIGDADIVVSGTHTYVLRYTVRRAPALAVDAGSRDWLNWNAIGTGWDVPIDAATVTLEVEHADDLELRCLAGAEGSDTEAAGCATSLAPYEGLTVQASWNHGPIAGPTRMERLQWALMEDWGVIVGVLALVIFFRHYISRGRDPAGRSTIIHEYDPPPGLTPAEAGTLVDMKADNRDLSATLVDLAARGYMRIDPVLGKKGKVTDYTFVKLAEPDKRLKPFESALLERVFQGGAMFVEMESLENQMASTWTKAREDLYASLTKDGYFQGNPQKVRTAGYAAGGALFFFWFMTIGLAQTEYGSGLGAGVLLLAAIIILIGARALPARTAKGVDARERILGLKRYFTVAEKERLAFEEAEQRYSALLPYALVLGVASQWTGRMSDLLRQPPSWYGGDPTTFNAVAFGSSIEQFSKSSSSSLSSSPSSSSSGSGSGGGTGGGGGGGGGGSW